MKTLSIFIWTLSDVIGISLLILCGTALLVLFLIEKIKKFFKKKNWLFRD
jgi:hypothetical protein